MTTATLTRPQRRPRPRRHRTLYDLPGVLDRPLTDAQWELYLRNQPLIGYCYSKCARRCMALSPAEEEALWECLDRRLIRAAQEFRPELGWKFSTFACKCLLWSGYADFTRKNRNRVRTQSLDQDVDNPQSLYDYGPDTYLVFAPGTEEDTGAQLDFAARVAWMTRLVGTRRADWIVRHVCFGESLAALARQAKVSKECVRQNIQAALGLLRKEMEGRVAS